ncbi:MAG: 1-(5-phosphoribosyl)-5-amino-4-imidazole-carboxylate carboxylase [Candidatus Anoxymicrobium japonicum]|uniref:1-(5-phosphoribosyl)-5-amino-4-imidazole-carboxylate carboxylase n=1 Tax=Candidatus Anoxymicrobium japonicum TaxID=2013648 RepID=A0A2N3G6L6_9ACTN|nr:MAG: 1-(5-phosphoribosyl)-5-amino-4-imidazole-carboxylate carboxylase [Candidatus Anoxymicrobium japonicum]
MTYEDSIKELLLRVEAGEVPAEKALESLRSLSFTDLEFARVDHHRELRQGFAEVVFCERKTPEQIAKITKALLENNEGNLLLTRADPGVHRLIRELDDRAVYHPEAKAITIEREMTAARGVVSIVSAGTADIPVAEEARVTASIMGTVAKQFYDVGVAGAHRLFAYREEFERSNAIVVVAGMEGALASLVGGLVSCPVIAVPTSVGYGASFGGLAALLTMMNSCAAGVGVVNIDNGFGAGYLAGLINRMISQAKESTKQ